MDFSYSDEQRMLKEMVDRLVADQYDFESRQGYRQSSTGYSPDVWQQFADLGLLGVPFAEELGGFGGGGAELMLLGESFGKALLLEPYLASVVLAGGLIDRLASADVKPAMLTPLIEGKKIYALACREADSGDDPFWVNTRLTTTDDGYRLEGQKSVVLHGGQADELLVVARSAGLAGDANGLSLVRVAADAVGVSLQNYPTIDGLQAAEVRFDQVALTADALLGEVGKAGDAVGAALDAGRVFLCAEAVGAMEIACDLTLEYLKERKQFGVPIGSFQALQHRMVEMRMSLEKLRSLTFWAACTLDAGTDGTTRHKRVAAAKAMAGKAGRHVAQEAIQLFGGMGMMDESPVSHYAKRIDMLDHWLGGYQWHRQKMAQLASS